ncbi:unnamed protein product [Didymodactylos carnosus]|uniref:HIG1 domain-containing protein n=1 Tax=Didymodactylos carnosus TaxID=1234261 RepID=A0A814DXJ7_9BILA|nr:unnamed protein product [Didymodactylos carnosus]CAF3737512.1 unnamed protein product [Didymodactylos carnosus]
MVEDNGVEPLKMVIETSSNSHIERNILNVVHKHFLDQRPITWRPIKVELIVNTELNNDFLGHSKCGVYVCKYADVCIRQASVRRTWEGSITIKMIVFKIIEGKQTAALVRKGPKLQPIAPTPQFTSHCSVITPKDTDDLEKQFDQSQIYLYELDGKDTVKRPHHVLPYAIVSLVQDGTQWPTSFDSSDFEPEILETDTLRVIAQTDDQMIKSKMNDNLKLAEAAMRALEQTYDDVDVKPIQSESTSGTYSSNALITTNNNNGLLVPMSNGSLSPTSTPSNTTLASALTSANSTIPPTTLITTNGLSATTLSTTQLSNNSTTTSNITKIPSSVATLPTIALPAASASAYHRQTSLLGALPTAAQPALYAANLNTTGLSNQIMYGGVPLEALRYQTNPYAFATHAGQAGQQPTLYAQLPAGNQTASQLSQMTTGVSQPGVSGIPPGYMLVRTANGGLALLGSQQVQRQQPQTALGTQTRLPLTLNGGGLQYGQQQVVYQYAAQPTIQAPPTQYIQLPAQYAHQQRLETSPVNTVAASQSTQQQQQHGRVTTTPQYTATSQAQYVSVSSQPTLGQSSASASGSSALNSQVQSQQQSPQQKQTSSNTALQQQQLLTYAVQAQQQQPQQQISFLTPAQLQAYANQSAYQQSLQSSASLGSQQMYYAGTSSANAIYQAGGQNYVIAQAPSSATNGTTAMYGYATVGAQYQPTSATGNGGLTAVQASAALQNNAASYAALSMNGFNTATQQQATQQPQYAYQISPYGTAGNQTYQVVDYPGYRMTAPQPTVAAAYQNGIVAQQQPQLVQRTNVLPQKLLYNELKQRKQLHLHPEIKENADYTVVQSTSDGYVQESIKSKQDLKDFQQFQGKTYVSTASDRAKQNPIIPIGMLATVAALVLGLRAMKRGDKMQSQYYMRARIGAQGVTILTVIASIMYAGYQQNDTAAIASPPKKNL